MKKIKTALALILVLSIFGTMLSGCDSNNSDSDASESESPSPSASADAEATTSVAAVEFDYEASSKFLDDDELVLSVNGSDVYWKEYYYWLKSAVGYSNYYSTLGDWDAEIASLVDGVETLSVSDAVMEVADNMVTYYRSIEQFANDMGLEVDDETKEEYKQTLLENYESEEALEDDLAANYLSMDIIVYMNTVNELYLQAYSELYGEDASKVTDEEAAAYAEENSLYQVKHILFSFTDLETEEEISDEEKATKKEQAESVAQLLKDYSGDDFDTYFQELSDEYNEDSGQSSYPNGYLYTSGSMVFDDEVEKLEENQVSDVVETTYGYHVILRLPVNYDDIPLSDSSGASVRYSAGVELMRGLITEKQESAEIVYGDAYKKIIPSDVFVIAETTTEEESPSPSETDAESSN